MEWTSLNDLREKYLSFFESKGHLRMPSFSLVPNNDKSLLLINSGMAPMKKYFTGEVTPPRKRVTTCQKCIRTPDIEQVGKTDRHGTFFEMLGNFSFGDYFKKEATAWAWEFCTKVLDMPVDKLYVTIYENDDEAYDIWTKQNGVDPSHIVRLGKEDNFWEHGSGPCGPCSEIYYDRGEKYGCGSPDCAPGCECDRFTEFWNNVFTQFDNDGNNNYTPLDHPNIDTGMGLERLALIMQGVDNIFEVDTFQNIMKEISEISGVKYHEDGKKDISLRVIADHVRSSTFMIGDGVIPSNNARGYVLRRLIRRACRHGRLLGVREPFLYKVCEAVIKENKNAYPELQDKRELIKKVILSEEESFGKTIDAGLTLLDEYIKQTEGSVFSGEDAFKLNDTYGFPLDLTKDVLEEKGMTVDEDKFNELLYNQKKTARAARKDAGADAWKGSSVKIEADATEFVGYTDFTADAEVLAIVNTDGELVQMLGAGEKGAVVLDVTPFYALSGGQVGDSGRLAKNENIFAVNDTDKNADGIYLHSGEVKSGILSVGDKVKADIDVARRRMIMRNHTAAHLLQHELRSMLGTHVEQAGQLVDDSVVRFDFTHFNALTDSEIREIEKRVNDVIMSAVPVTMREMPIEEAKKIGAMMLFGEKYGSIVRVVFAGDSVEFCGGTHVSNTGELGMFKIVSEASVASGVRRITAVTGTNAYNLFTQNVNLIKSLASMLKGTESDIEIKVEALLNANKENAKQISTLESEIIKLKSADLFSKPEVVDGLEIFTAKFDKTTPDALRSIGDEIKSDNDNAVAVIAGINGAKATIVAVCGKNAVKKGVRAGDVVREVSKKAGGGGGGRPDSAMAGAKELSKLDDAISATVSIVKDILG